MIFYALSLCESGFAYGLSEASPDSEQNMPTGAMLRRQDFASMEQIQDREQLCLSLAKTTNAGEGFISDFEIYKAFERVKIESIIMFATINTEIATRYLDTLRHIKPEITGKDLQEIGIAPSAQYTEIFDFILSEKLKNPALNKTQEIELVKKFYLIP